MAEQRYQAVMSVIADGLSISQAAEKAGVSRQTMHAWLARYEAEGLEGLKDRSHRPVRCPHQMPAVVDIDVLPIADSTDEIARLADEIEGAAGEFFPFEQLHGFSIDAVDLQTSPLPGGWRDRLVKVQRENTAAPSGESQFIGWCLDEALCVAKLCAPERACDSVTVLAAAMSPGQRDSVAVVCGTPSPSARFRKAISASGRSTPTSLPRPSAKVRSFSPSARVCRKG